MPPPRLPNPVSFPPTPLATQQVLKRPRDYAADDLDDPKASIILPPTKKQNQSHTKAEQTDLKGKRPTVGGDGDRDDGSAIHITPYSRRKRHLRPLKPEDEEKFREMGEYFCSDLLRNYIKETYGPPTPADPVSDGDNQRQANEGGSEGTMTGGSTPS